MEQLWVVNVDSRTAEMGTEGVTGYEPPPGVMSYQTQRTGRRGQRGSHPWERADVSFEGWIWEGKRPR